MRWPLITFFQCTQNDNRFSIIIENDKSTRPSVVLAGVLSALEKETIRLNASLHVALM